MRALETSTDTMCEQTTDGGDRGESTAVGSSSGSSDSEDSDWNLTEHATAPSRVVLNSPSPALFSAGLIADFGMAFLGIDAEPGDVSIVKLSALGAFEDAQTADMRRITLCAAPVTEERRTIFTIPVSASSSSSWYPPIYSPHQQTSSVRKHKPNTVGRRIMSTFSAFTPDFPSSSMTWERQ
mmetsp:Transcript_39242/g.80393  ORF Transcript_39242/g.80393 Transcript_39242/m.80393 type:complete len:182 (-) Transcript_39242:255-800(-)